MTPTDQFLLNLVMGGMLILASIVFIAAGVFPFAARFLTMVVGVILVAVSFDSRSSLHLSQDIP